jgi:hypothetical protein
MDRREALLLVERLKRRTRDPDVLARCGYFEQKLVDVTPRRAISPAGRAPGPFWPVGRRYCPPLRSWRGATRASDCVVSELALFYDAKLDVAAMV